MPLDATVGGATSNAFLTRARFKVLVADRPHSVDILDPSFDQDLIDQLIIQASLAISALDFEGVAPYADQALAFPRTGLTRNGGHTVNPATIPLEIERATTELAYLLRDSLEPIEENDIAVLGLTEIKASTIGLKFREQNPEDMRLIPMSAMRYIPRSWIKTPDDEITYVSFSVH